MINKEDMNVNKNDYVYIKLLSNKEEENNKIKKIIINALKKEDISTAEIFSKNSYKPLIRDIDNAIKRGMEVIIDCQIRGNMEVKLNHVKCKRCGYVWSPRKQKIYKCANNKCQSSKWNEDLEEKKK